MHWKRDRWMELNRQMVNCFEAGLGGQVVCEMAGWCVWLILYVWSTLAIALIQARELLPGKATEDG